MEHEGRPVALVLTRQKLAFIGQTVVRGQQKAWRRAPMSTGGPGQRVRAPQVVLMSSGSEVGIIVQAHQRLAEAGIASRVVSMASMELFEQQTDEYREHVLPTGVPRVAIEAAHPMSWYKWVGSDGTVIGLERFGASAKYEKIYEEFGLTAQKVVEQPRPWSSKIFVMTIVRGHEAADKEL